MALAARRLHALLALLLGAALACNRGPVRIPPTRVDTGSADAVAAGGDAPGDLPGADPAPADHCDLHGLLTRLPRRIAGWTLVSSPVYPYENFAGVPVGFVGRLFRNAQGCALIAAARPADPRAVFAALAAERAAAGVFRGRTTRTRAAPEANQVTTWVLDPPNHVLLVRAFGTTDPEALTPLLEASLPTPSPTAAGTEDAGGTDEDCAPGNPFADAYDPRAFYGPPGDCWL